MKRTILSIAAILFLHTVAVADPVCYSNCFEIVAGEYPTLVFTENRDVQIRIESYATDAHGWWTVSDASVTGSIFFTFCEVGSRIATANFGSGGNHISKDFSPREDPIFRFVFVWENRVPSGPSGYYAGWVSLIVNSANEPVVYGCEVSRYISEPVMGRGEPAHRRVPRNLRHMRLTPHLQRMQQLRRLRKSISGGLVMYRKENCQ